MNGMPLKVRRKTFRGISVLNYTLQNGVGILAHDLNKRRNKLNAECGGDAKEVGELNVVFLP